MKELVKKKESKYITDIPYWLVDRKRSAVVALHKDDSKVYILKHITFEKTYRFQWVSINVGSMADMAKIHQSINSACEEALDMNWRVLFLGEEVDTKLGENKEIFDIFNLL